MKKLLLFAMMCVLGLFSVNAQETVTVGEKTTIDARIPSHTWWNYSYSQQIYTASEINHAAGNIEKIAFFTNATAYTRTVKVYMQNVTKGSFATNEDWIEVTDADLVYDGAVTTDAVMEIALTTPFAYTGGNILLCVQDYTAAAPGGTSFDIYEDNATRSIFINDDDNLPGGENLTGFGQQFCEAKKNVLQLTFAAGEEGDDNTGDDNTGDDNTGDDNTGDDSEYLICERFENYEVGDKVAEKGNDCWTTWSGKEGGSEDAEIIEFEGSQCASFTYGNDQVIDLGGYASGSYEIEFDVYVPQGKSGYFNILHEFAGGNSVWAIQGHLHLVDDGSMEQKPSEGHGTIHAGGNSVADFVCVYDGWMHVRFVIDINTDVATLYSTLPGAEETKVVEWQWSKDSFGQEVNPNRKLDAMNFYPPLSSSAFYLDNFTVKQLSPEAAPELSFDQEIEASSDVNDVTTVEVTIENSGLSIVDYTAWIDYGVSEGGNKVSFLNYDSELSDSTRFTGLVIEEPSIIEIGAMYPGSSYASSAAGTKITHISYPFVDVFKEGDFGLVEGSDVVFRIYGQGTDNMPGECLAEKVVPYSSIKPYEFLTAKLDEPVVLTGFDVWATVSLLQDVQPEEPSAENPVKYPLLFDGMTSNLAPYGDMIRLGNDGPFVFAHEAFMGTYGNVHIRLTCNGEPVLGGWAEISGKVFGVLEVGEETTMEIELSTFGLKKGETYEAKVVIDVDNAEELFEIPLKLRVWGENVGEITNNNYNIYPNPTTGMVTVEGENINYVAVYNSVGQLIKVVKTQNNVVDMSACKNGVYFFDVVDNAGQSSVQRVVVAK